MEPDQRLTSTRTEMERDRKGTEMEKETEETTADERGSQKSRDVRISYGDRKICKNRNVAVMEGQLDPADRRTAAACPELRGFPAHCAGLAAWRDCAHSSCSWPATLRLRFVQVAPILPFGVQHSPISAITPSLGTIPVPS
jgi:hypothetical protein